MKKFEEDLKQITPNVQYKEITNFFSKTKTPVFYIDNIPFLITQSELDFMRKEGIYEKRFWALQKYVVENGEPF
jgi:hypothetical protein